MRGNIGEIALSGTDGTNKIVFDELQFLGDAAKRIVASLKQGNSPFDIECNAGICRRCIDFCFSDQRRSARRSKASSENGIDHRIGQVRLGAVMIAPERAMIIRQQAEIHHRAQS
jgi:hypothetical protein